MDNRQLAIEIIGKLQDAGTRIDLDNIVITIVMDVLDSQSQAPTQPDAVRSSLECIASAMPDLTDVGDDEIVTIQITGRGALDIVAALQGGEK